MKHNLILPLLVALQHQKYWNSQLQFHQPVLAPTEALDLTVVDPLHYWLK